MIRARHVCRSATYHAPIRHSICSSLEGKINLDVADLEHQVTRLQLSSQEGEGSLACLPTVFLVLVSPLHQDQPPLEAEGSGPLGCMGACEMLSDPSWWVSSLESLRLGYR